VVAQHHRRRRRVEVLSHRASPAPRRASGSACVNVRRQTHQLWMRDSGSSLKPGSDAVSCSHGSRTSMHCSGAPDASSCASAATESSFTPPGGAPAAAQAARRRVSAVSGSARRDAPWRAGMAWRSGARAAGARCGGSEPAARCSAARASVCISVQRP
jgi:hypothetical protein